MKTASLRTFLTIAVFVAAPILNGCGSQPFAVSPGVGRQSLSAATTEHVILSFRGKGDGSYPSVALIRDAAGSLYGATDSGGDRKCLIGCAIVFKLVPGSNDQWNEQVLQNFSNGTGISKLTLDRAGNLYGAAAIGGPGSNCFVGCGFVFELAHTSGGRWVKRDLYVFNGYDGSGPSGAPLFDKVGNLYGNAGSSSNAHGLIFQLVPSKSGLWKERILHQFQGSDGSQPAGGLAFDARGNIYGATVNDGHSGCSVGCGTVFQLSPAGSGWTFKSIHAFTRKGGYFPPAGVVVDARGNLYGTTVYGGSSDYGVVFELIRSSRWKEKVLHSFAGGSDGGYPNDTVTLDGSGNLYGTTQLQGTDGKGVAFELQPNPGPWNEVVLHAFSGGHRDGSNPYSGLTFGSDRRLYGTTKAGGLSGKGVVYAVTP